MEKLQQALKTAREKRQEAMPSGAFGSAAPPHQPPPSIDDAWEALPRFEPDVELLTKHRITSGTSGSTATPFDIMRTKIRIQMEKNGWKRLAITSPTPICGKTTVACNLAVGYGRQRDLRMILFEFDLRRPNMHRLFGATPESDMGSMLRGQSSFAGQTVRIQDTAAVCMAGRPAHDAGTLLSSQDTANRLHEIEAAYKPDLMVFDLPPLLVSEDVRAFLSNVDCAVLIAAADQTTVKEIDICEREIAEHTNVLGVVLNRCRYLDEASGYAANY